MKHKYLFKIYFYIFQYLPINIKMVNNQYMYGFYLQFNNCNFLYEEEITNYINNYNILLQNVIHTICTYLSEVKRDLSTEEINFVLVHCKFLHYHLLIKLNKKLHNFRLSAYILLKELKEIK